VLLPRAALAEPTPQQKKAIDSIKDRQGTVITVDDRDPRKPVVAVGIAQLLSDRDLTQLTALTDLRKLTVGRFGVSPNGMKALKSFTKLESLDLGGLKENQDRGLAHVAGLPALKSLRLSGCNTTDLGLAQLAKSRSLEKLVIDYGYKITGAGLAGLTALKNLRLYTCPKTSDAGLASLAKCPALEGLVVHNPGPEARGAWMGHLAKLPLRRLNLSFCRLDPNGFAGLRGQKRLDSLTIHYSYLGDGEMASLRGLAGLRTLDVITTGHISDAGLAPLAGLTNLESITLDYAKAGAAGVAHLKGLKKLRRLSLRESLVNDAALAHLAGLTELRELRLNNTQVTDRGLPHLRGLTKLQVVVLSYTDVKGPGLGALGTLTDLRELDLSRYGLYIAGKDLAFLKGLGKLKILRLGMTDDEGLKCLAGLTALELMEVGGEKITDQGFEQLKGLKNLRVLKVPPGVGDKGIGFVGGCKQLTSLDLMGSKVTDAGLKAVAGLDQLQQLSLSPGQVSPASLAVLKGLKGLKALAIGGLASAVDRAHAAAAAALPHVNITPVRVVPR
jgi:Leucine-rich repeat (LRR) protein